MNILFGEDSTTVACPDEIGWGGGNGGGQQGKLTAGRGAGAEAGRACFGCVMGGGVGLLWRVCQHPAGIALSSGLMVSVAGRGSAPRYTLSK